MQEPRIAVQKKPWPRFNAKQGNRDLQCTENPTDQHDPYPFQHTLLISRCRLSTQHSQAGLTNVMDAKLTLLLASTSMFEQWQRDHHHGELESKRNGPSEPFPLGIGAKEALFTQIAESYVGKISQIPLESRNNVSAFTGIIVPLNFLDDAEIVVAKGNGFGGEVLFPVELSPMCRPLSRS